MKIEPHRNIVHIEFSLCFYMPMWFQKKVKQS